MPEIHASAVVEPGAQLADDVVVGPFAYIGGQVKLGAGCVVYHHASVEGSTTAGEGNMFYPQCVIGSAPQDLKYRGGNCKLAIGDHNTFREACTVHIGTEAGGGYTRIGSHNLLMVNVHVAHDCEVGDHCVFANNVMLAGHVSVEDHVVLSGGVAAAHYASIGTHAFIGGFAAVVHDLPPFMISDGHPAMPRGVNRTGLRRRGITEERLEALRTAYKLLFSDRTPVLTQSIELEKLYPDNADVRQLIEFIRRSMGGKFGRYRETLRGKNTWSDEEENGDTNGK